MSAPIPAEAYIAARAPSYSTDPRVPYLLLQAQEEVGAKFGNLIGKAQALLVLHWLAMDDRAAASNGSSIGGTISGEKEGSLERRYMLDFKLTLMYPDYSQSRWGMEYIQLIKKSIVQSPWNRFSETIPDMPAEQLGY